MTGQRPKLCINMALKEELLDKYLLVGCLFEKYLNSECSPQKEEVLFTPQKLSPG